MPRHALLPRHAMPDYRHFPNRALRRGLVGSFTAMRWLALLVFAGMLSTILVSMPARAEVLKQPGYWINPTSDGQVSYGRHGISLSVTGYHGDNPEYCIEMMYRYIAPTAWESRVVDSVDYKIAASMVAAHRADRSDDVQAAISYAIHEHLDPSITPDRLRRLTDVGLEGGDIAHVRQLATQYWQEATLAAPQAFSSEYSYADCRKSGVIKVFAKNAAGGYASGVPFSIQPQGPIEIKQSSGTTTDGILEIPWTATGNGSAAYTVTYSDPIVHSSHNDNAQDIIRFEGEQSRIVPEIRFDVALPYQPTVSSVVPRVRVERGTVPLDTIVMGMNESGTWPQGVSIHVEGGLYGPYASKEQADDSAQWSHGLLRAESAHDFSTPGQSYTLKKSDVTATKEALDELPTGWYRWVWRIIKAHQSPEAQYPMLADYTDEHDVNETALVIHAMQVELTSQASASTAMPGQKLWDDVTLRVKDVNGDGKTDTGDWLHRPAKAGQSADSVETQIPLTLTGGLYMVPGTLPTGGSALPPGAVKIADACIVTNREGTVRADGIVSQAESAAGVSEDVLTMKGGYRLDDLPSGSYWWQWSVRNADQKAAREATNHAAAADYPLEHDVAMIHADPRESTEVLRMQPTVTSSVTGAYKDAQSFGTIDGDYKGDHSAVSVVDSTSIPWLGAAKAQRVEKGRRLLDTVTVGLDPTVGHNRWYVAGDASTPVTVRVRGALYGPLSREEAQRIITSAQGTQASHDRQSSQNAQGHKPLDATDVAAALPVAARAVLDVSQPGTYVIDGAADGAGELADTVTPGEGFDLIDPPSGWYLWQWSIANADQTQLAKQTGHAIRVSSESGEGGGESRPAYPFLHDVTDKLGSLDENIIVPTTPSLTSLVVTQSDDSGNGDSSGAEGKVRTVDDATGLLAVTEGSLVGDTVSVEASTPQDVWLQWTQRAGVSGVDAQVKPISVTLHGALYAVDEARWAQLRDSPLDAVPQWAGEPVATRIVKEVDHFGSYDVEPVKVSKPGVYVWYWQMSADLYTADHVTEEAWAQWTHRLVHHAFGLTSESFVVREDVRETGCSIRTEASDDVPVGGQIYDTAIITCLEGTPAGQIPDTVDFPLYRQDQGDDANADALVTVLPATAVDPANFPIADGFVSKTTAVRVESAKTVVDSEGTYYFAERGYVDGAQGFQGTRRCPDETVRAKELAQTGGAAIAVALVSAGCGGSGLVIRRICTRMTGGVRKRRH